MINDNILSISCECNAKFNENDFLNHFTICEKLFNKYKDFDSKISHLLRENIKSKESLYIIKFLFKRYIKVFDDKIKEYSNNNDNSNNKDKNNNSNKNENLNKDKNKNNDFNSKNNKEELQLQKNNQNKSRKQLRKEKKNLDLLYQNNPKNFKLFQTISSTIFRNSITHYVACIFTSIKNDNIYLAYRTYSINLECYNITINKPIFLSNQILNEPISSCRYYLDKKNIRDLLILSSDKNIKIFNFENENFSVLLHLNFQNESNKISTSYIINNNIVAPFIGNKKIIINLYDFNENCIKSFEEKELENVYSINTYFWKKENKNYVIITYSKAIFVYDDNFSDLFKKVFKGPENNEEFLESYMINNNESLILVGSCSRYTPSMGHLYFWDFEKGNLFYKIPILSRITGIDLWNNHFIFVSLYNGNAPFALVNIKKIYKEKKNNEEKNNNNEENQIFNFNDKKDKSGYGIHILRHKRKGDYLISILEKGKLNLFKIQ